MTAIQLPPMTRADLLSRCKSEGERLQELSIAVGAIAGTLRADIMGKSESDDYKGLTAAQQEGLMVALELIADKLYQDGDSLETMAFRQGAAALPPPARRQSSAHNRVTGQPSPTGRKADFPPARLADLFRKWERLGGRDDGRSTQGAGKVFPWQVATTRRPIHRTFRPLSIPDLSC